MKNKNKLFLICCFFLFILLEKGFSEQFEFEAKEIEISDSGNILTGKNDVKVISDNGIEIKAEKFLYDKEKSILSINGNVVISDFENNVQISGEEFI